MIRKMLKIAVYAFVFIITATFLLESYGNICANFFAGIAGNVMDTKVDREKSRLAFVIFDSDLKKMYIWLEGFDVNCNLNIMRFVKKTENFVLDFSTENSNCELFLDNPVWIMPYYFISKIDGKNILHESMLVSFDVKGESCKDLMDLKSASTKILGEGRFLGSDINFVFNDIKLGTIEDRNFYELFMLRLFFLRAKTYSCKSAENILQTWDSLSETKSLEIKVDEFLKWLLDYLMQFEK